MTKVLYPFRVAFFPFVPELNNIYDYCLTLIGTLIKGISSINTSLYTETLIPADSDFGSIWIVTTYL